MAKILKTNNNVYVDEHNENENFLTKTKNLKLVIKDSAKNLDSLKKLQKVSKVFSVVLTYAFLFTMALIIIVPFYWMLITSLKSQSEIRNELTFFPKAIQWVNYIVLFKGGIFTNTGDVVQIGGSAADALASQTYVSPFNFWTYLSNTLIVGILSTFGTLITTIFAAFAFSRLNFKGKDLLFTIFLGTMMIPGEMLSITNYITVAPLLTNKAGALTAMIVPFWVSVFYIFQLRQNFKQIPNELYYAAKVDGKSDWQYLWKVMVPLASPALVTIIILKVMGSWNSYIWPNLVANNEEWRLMTNGLRSYSPTVGGNPHQGIQMAATAVVTVPLLLLFVCFRKYIMRGVGRAGLKG